MHRLHRITMAMFFLFTLTICSSFPAMAGNIPEPTIQDVYERLDSVERKLFGIQVLKSGQTRSYKWGDDGYWQKGFAFEGERFTVNGDGTATDNLTDLVWTIDLNCFGAYSWNDALVLAYNLRNGWCGLTDGSAVGDWRLPNIRELQSLIDHGQAQPALPAGHPFLWTHEPVWHEWYWTSTSAGEYVLQMYPTDDAAWRVSFNYGEERITPRRTSEGAFERGLVWAVRDKR